MKLFASCPKLFDNSMSLTTTLTINKKPIKISTLIVIVLLLLIIKEQKKRQREKEFVQSQYI